MADLHLATINGEPTVSIGFDRDEMMAASFIALGESILAGKLSVEQAIVVAVVDGAVTYTAFGHVTLVEGVGLLELASRKVERDMLA
jgi:hypothetical protein